MEVGVPSGLQGLSQTENGKEPHSIPYRSLFGQCLCEQLWYGSSRALRCAIHHRMTRAREQRKQTNSEEKQHKLSVEVPWRRSCLNERYGWASPLSVFLVSKWGSASHLRVHFRHTERLLTLPSQGVSLWHMDLPCFDGLSKKATRVITAREHKAVDQLCQQKPHTVGRV